MSEEALDEVTRRFDDLIDNMITNGNMAEAEQAAFILGAFTVLTAYFIAANPKILAPFEKERFMGVAKTRLYNLLLKHTGTSDATKEAMKVIMDEASAGMVAHYRQAAEVQEILVGPLSAEEKHVLATTIGALS